MRKGAAAYLAASVVSQGAALTRYVILARMLGPEELGFAAMLILTSQFFESVSDTGSDRFLIQDKDGDSPVMQRFVQMVMVGRGVMIATLLVLSSHLLSLFYNAPSLTPAIIAMGLAPLVMGLMNMDLYRVQRAGNFKPESIAIIVGELCGLAGTVVAATLTHDHTAVIYGFVARAIGMVLVSHCTAQRRYGWGYAKAEGLRFSRFAAPLALNGLMLFAGSQGDRLIIGSHLGPAALGQYSAIMLLIYYPTSAIAKFLINFHLPQVAGNRETPAVFAKEIDLLGGRSLLLGAAMAAGFTVVGPLVAPLLYGPRFAQPAQIFALLAVLQGLRFLRLWPTTIAIATGRSGILLANNIARMVALPAAIGANMIWSGLETILYVFTAGELLAIVVALALLSRDGWTSPRLEFARTSLFLAISGLILGWAWAWQARSLVAALVLIVLSALVLGATVRREWPTIANARGFVMRRLASR